MKSTELLTILKPFLPLCEEEKEYGGWINLDTGETEGPFKGEERSVDFGRLDEVRAKAEEGWATFHTHPRSAYPEPSLEDVYAAHRRGTVDYVITIQGIYAIRPKEVLSSADQVERIWSRASILAEEIKSLGGDVAWRDHWRRVFTEFLPTEVYLLEDPLAEPSSDRVVTA